MYWRLSVAEWREGIRTAIPDIVECLNAKDSDVRRPAIEVLSKLGAQGVGYVSTFPFDLQNNVCS